MSFRDHRGPGGVFRLMPSARRSRSSSSALPRASPGARDRAEGLVLVAGPRSSGKRTLMSAFVDLINRTRRDHIITIETRNQHRPRARHVVHQPARSARQRRRDAGGGAAALREDPDVLVIEDLRTGALMNVALEAARSGRLVVGGFSAHTADRRDRSHHRSLRAGVPASGAGRARRHAARRRRSGAAAEDRRRPGAGARSAAEHAGGVERHRRRQDVAAADGDRRRAPLRHGADQRRARRSRSERRRRRARSVPALGRSCRVPVARGRTASTPRSSSAWRKLYDQRRRGRAFQAVCRDVRASCDSNGASTLDERLQLLQQVRRARRPRSAASGRAARSAARSR